jgi:competence ComEA-like helix-hairpin-helix protein
VTAKERRSLALLLGLAAVGHLVRSLVDVGPQAPPAISLLDSTSDGNPGAHLDSIRRLAAPLGPEERIDVDRASAEELARLPGIGPAVARRIVADRQSRGAFGSIEGLDRVPGVGPTALARWRPHLLFTGIPADTPLSPEAGQVDLNTAGVDELDALPGIGGVRARAIIAFRDSAGPFRDEMGLSQVPGISRALARQLAPRLLVR